MALEFGTTSHGMEVFVDRMPGMQTARIALDVGVGSIHEQPGEQGLAHVLEHAVHLRSPRFKRKADLTRFQGINAITANAYTNFDHTEYHGKGPFVEPIVAMLGEVVTRPEFVPEDIDPEMDVVNEEVRQRLNNFSLLHTLASSHVLFGGAYGRDISGHLKHLKYDTEDVEDFYGKYYAYENMQLWGVGNVALGELIEYAERHLSPLPEAPVAPQKGGTHDGLAENIRSGYILEKSETNYHTIATRCGPELSDEIMHHPFVFDAAENVLSNYALDVLRNRDGIAYGAYVYTSNIDRDTWELKTYTTAAADHLGRVDDAFVEIMDRPVDRYPTDDILAGIGQCRSAILSVMDNINSRADRHRNFMSLYGAPQDLSELADRVRSLNVDEVRAAMDRLLRHYAESPKLTHLTGTAGAIGDVDVIVTQDDIM